MIEILEHGISIRARTKKRFSITCPFCSCKFIFDDNDIISKEKRFDGYSYVACPECKKTIIKFLENEHLIGVIENNENVR